MPHSSGGGFHGGGFHGGGFSGHHYGRGGARSGLMVSRTRFPGSTAWLYYTSRGVPHLVYSSVDITKMPKANAFTYVLLGIFVIAPIAIMLATGIKSPKKIDAAYGAVPTINDTTNILRESEEVELLSIFDEFQRVSGITPSIKTITNGEWNEMNFWASLIYPDAKYTLEDYAYKDYVASFKDEKHWLIVYASDEGTKKGHFAFENMQGYETDSILFPNVTERFGVNLYNALEEEGKSVGDSFIYAFNDILPDLLKTSFYIDPEMVAFTVVWEIIVGIIVATTIAGHINSKNYATAQKVENPESIVMKKCKHCGATYYKGTVQRCPKCGRSVVMDDELE